MPMWSALGAREPGPTARQLLQCGDAFALARLIRETLAFDQEQRDLHVLAPRAGGCAAVVLGVRERRALWLTWCNRQHCGGGRMAGVRGRVRGGMHAHADGVAVVLAALLPRAGRGGSGPVRHRRSCAAVTADRVPEAGEHVVAQSVLLLDVMLLLPTESRRQQFCGAVVVPPLREFVEEVRLLVDKQCVPAACGIPVRAAGFGICPRRSS